MNVSESALRQRVCRALARDGERLITPRPGSSAAMQYGPHYIVDERNVMQAWCCELDELGRELGVLRVHEQIRSCPSQ